MTVTWLSPSASLQAYCTERSAVQMSRSTLEGEIDQLAQRDQLYGLSEEEIKIVEEQ